MKTKSVLLSLLFISTAALAQRSGERTGPAHISNHNKWYLGVHVGQVTSVGDLKSFESEKAGLNFGFGASLGRQINYTFGIRFDGTIGKMSGSNQTIQGGRYFEGKYNEMIGLGTINLSNLFLNGRVKERNWIWTFGIGAGLNSWNSVVYDFKSDSKVGEIEQGPEWTLQPVIPAEFGAKYRINDRLNLGLRVSARWVLSDDWDGLRYNEGDVEGFAYTNVSLNYVLGKKAESAEWTNPLDNMYFEVQDMAATIDGMSNDADGDGVADLLDQDDYTPEGVAVDGSGRALDIDNDGVPDHLDADPFTSRGASVDENGRELDSDGDGVADSRDLDPNTPKGALVNFQGKEIKANGAGLALPSVFFSFNSTVVNYANYERLATLARAMKNNPNMRLRVVGNTDARGGEDANMKIAEKRAQAVVDHLNKIYGIDASRFEVVAKGESELLADGVHRINRRVDFEVIQ